MFSIHNDINNCVYTTQERADQGTTKSRSEAYETIRRSDPASFLRSVVGRSDETRSNEGMRSYGVVYNNNLTVSMATFITFFSPNSKSFFDTCSD